MEWNNVKKTNFKSGINEMRKYVLKLISTYAKFLESLGFKASAHSTHPTTMQKELFTLSFQAKFLKTKL